MTLYVRGMHGLGDQLHSRPLIRAAAAREGVLYLSTPWPQLFADCPGVRCVHPNTKLRTQQKNERRPGVKWWPMPDKVSRTVYMGYGSSTMRQESLHATLGKLLPLEGAPFVYDAPDFGPSPVQTDKPVAVVRPVTVRSEWCAIARNPRPEYVAIAADELAALGYHVVSVADVDGTAEWFDGTPPPSHQQFHRGELDVERLFALIANAAMVVTPVGWCLHAGIAYRTPTICIAGGRGGHCAPEKETDPRQDLARLRWIMPDNYCRCDMERHNCEKGISDFRTKFRDAHSALHSIGRVPQ